MSKLTYIDLFCGAGGLGEGFSRLNYKHIYSVDNADYAIQTAKIRKAYWHLNITKQRKLFYKYLHENSEAYNWASFQKYNPELFDQIESTFSTADLSQDSIPGHIKKINLSLKKQRLKYVDVIIGGPPCQAYSLVGRSRYRSQDKKINAERIKQNLSDNRHHLYQVYLSLVSIIKPKIFVYENVPGLITAKSNKGRIIQLIKNDFENLDPAYKIIGINHEIVDQIDLFGELPNFKNYIINCADFGVPQKRKRVIMIGIRNDHYGKVKNRVDKFFKSIEILKVDDKINVRDAISDLPPLYSKDKINRGSDYLYTHSPNKIKSRYLSNYIIDSKIKGTLNHYSRSHMKNDLERYKWYAQWCIKNGKNPTILNLPEELKPAHKNQIRATKGKAVPFIDRFKVQRWDFPGTTVTAHISKDGHYYIHPDPKQNRSMTVREVARLQSFPDNYVFCGPRTAQYKQVGNAVPPLLSYVLAKSLKEILK